MLFESFIKVYRRSREVKLRVRTVTVQKCLFNSATITRVLKTGIKMRQFSIIKKYFNKKSDFYNLHETRVADLRHGVPSDWGLAALLIGGLLFGLILGTGTIENGLVWTETPPRAHLKIEFFPG